MQNLGDRHVHRSRFVKASIMGGKDIKYVEVQLVERSLCSEAAADPTNRGGDNQTPTEKAASTRTFKATDDIDMLNEQFRHRSTYPFANKELRCVDEVGAAWMKIGVDNLSSGDAETFVKGSTTENRKGNKAFDPAIFDEQDLSENSCFAQSSDLGTTSSGLCSGDMSDDRRHKRTASVRELVNYYATLDRNSLKSDEKSTHTTCKVRKPNETAVGCYETQKLRKTTNGNRSASSMDCQEMVLRERDVVLNPVSSEQFLPMKSDRSSLPSNIQGIDDSALHSEVPSNPFSVLDQTARSEDCELISSLFPPNSRLERDTIPKSVHVQKPASSVRDPSSFRDMSQQPSVCGIGGPTLARFRASTERDKRVTDVKDSKESCKERIQENVNVLKTEGSLSKKGLGDVAYRHRNDKSAKKYSIRWRTVFLVAVTSIALSIYVFKRLQ